MNCPKCQSSMEQVTQHGVEVDRCQHCGGLWFDKGEREKLRGLPGATTVDSGNRAVGSVQNRVPGKIECPRCAERMEKLVGMDEPQIHFEACSSCGGAYFDAGEFESYVKASAGA